MKSGFESEPFEYVVKRYCGIRLKNYVKSSLKIIKRKNKKLVSKGGKRNTSTI